MGPPPPEGTGPPFGRLAALQVLTGEDHH
ncbi:hypothetical protein MICRO80W_60015 [Micrococcus luteus]|nr:hypothetical protein MICRO80W_60015 [Micrococcus luteus]